MALISRNLIALEPDYVTVSEDGPIVSKMSVNVLAKTDPCSSRMVSVRQLNFLVTFQMPLDVAP